MLHNYCILQSLKVGKARGLIEKEFCAGVDQI